VSNRSFNDLTQYPIFPWVISDFKNKKLNLEGKNSHFSYRDLSKPIGGINPDKLEQFKSKYFEVINKTNSVGSNTMPNSSACLNGGGGDAVNDKPYMYLSHYSTPGIVLYYLIR
jgi:factor associated with neutral sphingomyelinase activation